MVMGVFLVGLRVWQDINDFPTILFLSLNIFSQFFKVLHATGLGEGDGLPLLHLAFPTAGGHKNLPETHS